MAERDRRTIEIENLVETLALEPIEVNLFRGVTSGRDGAAHLRRPRDRPGADGGL